LVTIWTPLVAVALLAARKVSATSAPGPGLAAALVACSFALAALAAGLLLGRFGRTTQLRHGAFAGLLAALEIWLLALLGAAFASTTVALSALVSLSLLAGSFSALGAWLSRRSDKARAVSRDPS